MTTPTNYPTYIISAPQKFNPRSAPAPNASEWQNALTLATLLFSLPASNGKLERVFSTLHLIKDKKRSRLTNEALDDLVLLKSSAVSLEAFDPDPSIDLWWAAKNRRPDQRQRKQYKARKSQYLTNSTSTTTDEDQEDESDDEMEKTYLKTGTKYLIVLKRIIVTLMIQTQLFLIVSFKKTFL